MMLLGRHPFDLDCDATDEEIGVRIKEQQLPSFDITRHLSDSAMDLLSKLMDPDPQKRMTAHDMLHHPWVTGETAREDVIEDSAERLKAIHKYKSGIEKRVIESLLSFQDDESETEDRNVISSERRTSLLERAFDQMDKDKKGYLSKEDLKSLPTTQLIRRNTKKGEVSADNLSFNHFSDLVGQNIRSMHFPRGHVVYREDDEGDYMYFINSGTLEVSTKDGFTTKIGQGDYFGKGGVLGKKRRTTITCTTPVNVLRLDKELFMKYVVKGSPLGLKLREKINTEKFDRALSIIGRNANMIETSYKKGGAIFKEGEEPSNDAYIVKQGLVDIIANDHHVQTLKPGRLFGVQSFIHNRRSRKASAVCMASECVINSIPLKELDELAEKYPQLKSALHELALRQEFRRAIVLRRMQSFPTKAQLREVFDSLDTDRDGTIDAVEVRELMQTLGGAFSDEEIATLIRSMDLTDSGNIDYDEFASVFGNSA
jgi:CRP-like cAMP-binding protein